MYRKKISTNRIEKILKKQSMVFSYWNCSNTKDDPYQMWYLSLKKLLGRVILFDPRKERLIHGSEIMKKKFFSLIKRKNPDYLFTNVRRDEQTIYDMEKVHKISPKTKIISFSGDDDKDFEPLKRYQALFVDCTFIAQPGWDKKYLNDEIKNIFHSFSINNEIFKPLNMKKTYDVTFIGKPLEYRIKLIRFLLKNGVNVKLFGRGWQAYPEFKKFYGGVLETKELVKVINTSKINLSLLKNEYGQTHFKGRVLMFPMCRAFSLTEYFSGCLKFFKNNKEVIMFKNEKDLLDKIKYYLKHEKERETISKNAYNKSIKNHSAKEDFKIMFKKIIENPKAFSAKFPKIKGKVITMKKSDIDKSKKELKKLVDGFDYIALSDGNSTPLKYKDYLQAYSLEKTKKQISCCDAHIYDKVIGEYLTTKIYKAFRLLKTDEFNSALSVNQLMVKREFFLKNITLFRHLFSSRKTNIINGKTTCLVSLPLVRINRLPCISLEIFQNFFHKDFIIKLYLLWKQKRLFLSAYFYRVIYLMIKNPILMKFFIASVKDRKNRLGTK